MSKPVHNRGIDPREAVRGIDPREAVEADGGKRERTRVYPGMSEDPLVRKRMDNFELGLEV